MLVDYVPPVAQEVGKDVLKLVFYCLQIKPFQFVYFAHGHLKLLIIAYFLLKDLLIKLVFIELQNKQVIMLSLLQSGRSELLKDLGVYFLVCPLRAEVGQNLEYFLLIRRKELS